MKVRRYACKAICLLAGLAIAAIIPMSAPADDGQSRGHQEIFTIDVALDSATLVVNHVDPTQPPTAQLPGDTLLIKGTIYRGELYHPESPITTRLRRVVSDRSDAAPLCWSP
jgi:hypothetical protein